MERVEPTDSKRARLRSAPQPGPALAHLIDRRLKEMVARPGQSVRMQNVLRRKMRQGNAVQGLVNLYLTDRKEHYSKFCGTICWGVVAERLRSFVDEFVGCYLDWIQLDEATATRLDRQADYPYLTNEQLDFLDCYMADHGHRPIFFLMVQQLLASNERNLVLFSRHYGLADGKMTPMNALGEEYGLTRTAISLACDQVGDVLLNTLRITPEEIAAYAPLLSQPVLSELTPGFVETMRQERLDLPTAAFQALIHMVSNTVMVMEKEKGRKHGSDIQEKKVLVLVQRTLCRTLNLTAYRTELCRRLTLANNEDYIFDLRKMCTELDGGKGKKVRLLADKPLPKPLAEQLAMFLDYCVYHYYGIKPDKNHRFLWKRNHLSPKLEVEKILRDFNRVMTLQEILEEFTRRFPGSKYCNPEKLRSHIILNDKIGSVSHRSKYGLKEWEGVFIGSIRSRLLDILRQSGEPMHINDIMRPLLETFPDTTANAVKATMWLDEQKRFAIFQGDYYGLAGRGYTVNNVPYERQQYPFSERLNQLRNFIAEHHRLPSYKGDAYERTLTRWMRNAKAGRRRVTQEEMEAYDKVLDDFKKANYPTDIFE